MFDFTKNMTRARSIEFSTLLKDMSETIGFKVSSRGWCYLMEQAGYIDKSQFSKVEDAINKLRKNGMLPVDFVAEEDARMFENLERPTEDELSETLKWMLRDVLDGDKYYTPDWWDGEEYYIQMIVEKIDLKTLFAPVCKEYHIPIANAKGWSSILQRAEYCRRFKQAEEKGLKCVLLYCGDHDADGLRISDTIRKNLEDIQEITWDDGVIGYNPEDLIIERFGLNYDFILRNRYTWIDNLITGSGKDLADPRHPNFKLPYVQDYIKGVGVRKCEANAIVTTPREGRDLCRKAIEAFLGVDAKNRFAAKRAEVKQEYARLLETTNLSQAITAAIEDL